MCRIRPNVQEISFIMKKEGLCPSFFVPFKRQSRRLSMSYMTKSAAPSSRRITPLSGGTALVKFFPVSKSRP